MTSKGRDGGPSRVTRGGWTPVGTSAGRRESHARAPTPRGQRTRRQVVEAARRVFERSGYVDATVDDITREAGVARGSFYTYFASKLAVFEVLADEVDEKILAAVTTRTGDERMDPMAALDRSNRRYIEVYRSHAALYGLIEQVSTVDPTVHERRLRSRQIHVGRVAQTIARWQRRGIADPELDPETAAAALVSMISNFCYWWFVGGDAYDPETAARTLSEAWIRTTRLQVGAPGEDGGA